MTSQTTAPAIIHKLVETFEQNLDSYRFSKNETELRREFLDKFFTALGWDVVNEKGYDELGKEVIHEFSVDVAGQQKKADYAFRVGRGEKFDFLVEAKKPSVKVETSQEAAFQIRRYGWSAKLPINILTDFEHFAVYDCRTKPSYNDKASMGRIMLIHYEDYVSKWNEILEIFSPEAVRKGSFAKYTEGMKGKKGTADVDDAFLQEIERWREALAQNIALRNDDIDIAGLNYSVQITIDRIVFLRICEERGIEPENQLLEITNTDNVYEELCELFKRADTKYNSGLFHFKNEKEIISRPDDLTLSLSIDDKVLKDIISNLYYPKSPYAFLYIPSDILGQVYERFLGKVIRLTARHRAKVEEKPEVRKAGGVYYTPTYIVEYIVKNTVGKLAENKSPKDIASLKIVDPACGSGTFLLGAYQFLLDWHLNWYVENEPEKAEKNKAIVKVGDGYRLTTAKKKEILINNIHGVDIDAQAVEVTKLSLLLKVLENASGQLGLGIERVLPDLGNNIKFGNSLIGFDYFEGKLIPDEEERARVNPFDWQNEFEEVFAKGGFDIVIGNPPYRKERESKELLADLQKSNYGKKYYQGKMDFWYFFLHLAIDISKKGGLISFITPSYWLASTGSSKLIVRVKDNCTFLNAVDFSKNKIFDRVSGNHMVYVLLKDLRDSKVIFQKFTTNNLSGDEIGAELKNVSVFSTIETVDSNVVFTSDGKIDFTINKFSSIIDKLSSGSFLLDDDEHVFEVSQGLVEAPDAVSQAMADKANLPSLVGEGVFVIPKTVWEKIRFTEIEKKFIKPYLRLQDVKKYRYSFSDFYVFYIGNQDNKEILHNRAKYPHIVEHLDKYKKIITSSNAPYGIHRTREQRFFTAPKIIGANMFDEPSFTYCEEEYYVNFGFNVIVGHSASYDLRYLTGILNSKVGTFWFNLYGKKRGVNNDVGVGVLRMFPVHAIHFNNHTEKAQHDKMVSLVEQMSASYKSLSIAKSPQDKERLERQIEVTNKAIDSLVYELYGLTDEEIKIVEGK